MAESSSETRDESAVPPTKQNGANTHDKEKPAAAAAPPSPGPKCTSSLLKKTTSPISVIDDFLCHLERAAKTRAGAGAFVSFLSYTCRASGCIIEALASSPPTRLPLLSSALAAVLSPARALRLAGRLKAAANMFTEWHAMNRLWGLLGLYALLKSEAKAAREGSKSAAASAVALTQVVALVSFQIVDNLMVLSNRKIVPAPQLRFLRAGMRCWLLYVSLELGRLVAERISRVRSTNEEAVDAEAEAAWADEWFKKFGRTLAWAPIAAHASFANGPLTELTTSLLACYPATGYVSDFWASSR